MLSPTIKQYGAGKSRLSYAGINRGQVQRVFLSLPVPCNIWKQQSTPSLYGYACKLKDNAEDCKLEPRHRNNKHLIKQMVLTTKTLPKALFTVTASPSAAIRTKYGFLKYLKTEI
jgi:hypothetical protein